jgi:hypothetical protein
VNASDAGQGRPADPLGGPQEGRPADSVGSAAEEAVKLIEALGEWASSYATAASQHLATGAPECSLCPICQAIRVLRQARPEVVPHLGDAVGSIVAALRTAVDAGERQRAAGRSARLEHIDIG